MLNFRRCLFLLLAAAWPLALAACGGDSPNEPPPRAIVIRAEGYVHSQTDGSPIGGAEVELYRLDPARFTVIEVGNVRTDGEGYYSFEAEYPYSCSESGWDPYPMLTAHKHDAYGATDRRADCSTQFQRIDFELAAWSTTRVDTLYFSPDTLRLAVGESAVLPLIVLDTNADTLSSHGGHPWFAVNEGIQWYLFGGDAASLSLTGSFAVNVAGQAVGRAGITVYFQHKRRPWDRITPGDLEARATIIVE